MRLVELTRGSNRNVFDMNNPLNTPPLINGPYRVVPGTKLVHVDDDRWAVDAPGTRRQNEFVPLRRLVLRARDFPEVLAPGAHEGGPMAGQIVTADSCQPHVLAALVREQALVRAPADVIAADAELDAAVASGRSGVLLIAMGKPNYGRLVAALAETIKSASPKVPVALAWSGDVLTALGEARGVFDHLIPIREALPAQAECSQAFYAKLCVDQLSPFDHTIFIDADSLIYPGADLRKEFWRYSGHGFVPTTSLAWQLDALPPDAAYLGLGSIEPIVKYFGLKQPMLQVHSYYFYFERSHATNAVFECARDVYRAIAANVDAFKLHLTHERLIADELALGVATSIVGVSPLFEQHQPMVESGLFFEGPEPGLETCYLGFTVAGYLPCWFAHYRETLERHGLGHRRYELEKEMPGWLR
jgi:hypothetical protein